jgi:hypothetical protein
MYRLSVGKPEGKTSLGRPIYRCVDNINMDLCKNRMGWTGLVWLRIAKSGELL